MVSNSFLKLPVRHFVTASRKENASSLSAHSGVLQPWRLRKFISVFCIVGDILLWILNVTRRRHGDLSACA